MTHTMSRRSVLRAGAALGAIPAFGAAVQPAFAKISQASVDYQGEPKGANSCGNCNLFVAPNACKTVDGEVSEKGWCKIWVKKVG